MASHHCHYLQHHRCHPTTATVTTPWCCCCYSTCCTPPPPDPLLQPVAPPFHHTPPQPYLYSSYLSPPHNPQSFHHRQTPYHPPPTHPKRQEELQHHHHYPQQQQQQQTQPVVSSLLRRIAALESSLRHQFSASSYSLCDAAARTIQTHFRAFLVRRSRTLRQLKDLASIKSTLNALKASLSDNAYLDSQALSRRAMDLLLKLDSIQGADPMIRDGKRSISRDLIRFLEFIDGLYVKRNKLSSMALKNVRFGAAGNKSRVLYSGQKIGSAEFLDPARDERELMEQLRSRVQKIRVCSAVPEDDDEKGIELENARISINGVIGSPLNRNGGSVRIYGGDQPKVKKTVSFANNGNVSRVFITTHEPNSGGDVNSSDGDGSVGDDREVVDNPCREVKEIGGFWKGSEDEEEACAEDGESPRISGGGRKGRRNLRAEENYGIRGHYQGDGDDDDDDGNFVFSAPLPVKMESRADLMKRERP